MYSSQMEGLNVSAKVYDLIRDSLPLVHTEKELFSIIKNYLYNKGYTQADYLFDFLSGHRTSEIDGPATEKNIAYKDLLLVDFSLKTNGFWCDTCRTFFYGSPSSEQEKAYKAVLKAMNAGAKALSPGVCGSQIYRTVMESLKQDGFETYMPHHSGHGVGRLPQTKPSLNLGSTDSIKAGETVTLEPGIYFPEKWGIRVENDFFITENNAQSMFTYPLEIDYFIL